MILMNKKIKSYILILLCFFSSQIIHVRPLLLENISSLNIPVLLENIPFPNQKESLIFYLQSLQKIISDYPKLSLIVTAAAIISFFCCTTIIFSRNHNKLDTTIPSKAEIYCSTDQNNATLMLTPHNKPEPYCYNHLHSYEVSPLGTYILARQLNETSIVSVASKAFFKKEGVLSTIQNALRSSSMYHVIDMAGTIILSLTNAQQCCFSKNEKLLLIP